MVRCFFCIKYIYKKLYISPTYYAMHIEHLNLKIIQYSDYFFHVVIKQIFGGNGPLVTRQICGDRWIDVERPSPVLGRSY